LGELSGKTALVTAAANGIGRAAALAYAEAGANVIATDLDIANMDDLAAHDAITVRKLDVLDGAAVRDLATAHPDIGVLVSCAGYVHHGSLENTDDKAWDFSFDLNVKSAFHLLQAIVPNMLARGGGALVVIASVSGSILGIPNRCAYGASKAALIGLAKSVAADYIRQGIRCNAICPGTVDSPSLRQRIRDQGGDYDEVRSAFIARQPMGRLGEAQEMADLAVYLGSDKSKFMTGQTVCIDGGMTLM